MGQLTLFVATETLLVDDQRGRIAYTPAFIDAGTAQAWFAELRTAVNWRAQRRMMYEREVDVPRLVSGFRLDPNTESTPQAILDAARRVTERVGEPFNSVGLNLYRDGRDSVAPHNDHLNEIRTGFSIALVSLGASRRLSIRAKVAPRSVMHVDLEPGSLFVMSYTTQLHYTHAVPKTSNLVGERISLAFRVKHGRGGEPARVDELAPTAPVKRHSRPAAGPARARVCQSARLDATWRWNSDPLTRSSSMGG